MGQRHPWALAGRSSSNQHWPGQGHSTVEHNPKEHGCSMQASDPSTHSPTKNMRAHLRACAPFRSPTGCTRVLSGRALFRKFRLSPLVSASAEILPRAAATPRFTRAPCARAPARPRRSRSTWRSRAWSTWCACSSSCRSRWSKRPRRGRSNGRGRRGSRG